jgi:hypothetical protein
MDKKFAAVEYPMEATVEAVPFCWIGEEGNSCRFPNLDGVTIGQLRKLIQASKSAPPQWNAYPCKLLGR